MTRIQTGRKGLIGMAIGIFCLCAGAGDVQASTVNNQLIIINKKSNMLAYYNLGSLVRVFPVATGREVQIEGEDPSKASYTPEGTFQIVVKERNRPYYKAGIPGGDPSNPLGDRWMGLNPYHSHGDIYGIHGNSNEDSIGKHVTHGCVRMHNEDIHWLFDKIKINTPVVITTTNQSFNEIAYHNGYPVNVEKVNANVGLTENTFLYTQPYADSKTAWVLAPQKVKVFEKMGNWYGIHSVYGDLWLNGEHTMVGDPEQKTEEIHLDKNTQFYASPFPKTGALGSLAPQTVTSFEECNGWYHIQTYKGTAWIRKEEQAKQRG
ncbi:L,D-transpeptidase [Aneurinibacillus terranovensis]|uniref:L,D-transpeptidase n=1 Tax=Aneurinibacillus terranovensis TaxID=278991 RepID=UPI0004039385|nr:L,D-transpeptidase family protein [Aneurinibacillus terranovensis]